MQLTAVRQLRAAFKSPLRRGKLFVLGGERRVSVAAITVLLLPRSLFLSFPFTVRANWPSQSHLNYTGTQTSLYNALATAGSVAS